MSSKMTKGGLPFAEGGLKVGWVFHARRRRWVDLFSRPIKGGLGFRVIGTNLHGRYRTMSVARLSDHLTDVKLSDHLTDVKLSDQIGPVVIGRSVTNIIGLFVTWSLHIIGRYYI